MNLSIQYLLYIRKIRYFCKLIDTLHRKLHGIQLLLCILACLFVPHTPSILFNTYDIGMLILDTYQYSMLISGNSDTDLQGTAALLMMYIHCCLFKKSFHLRDLFRTDMRNNLQSEGWITGDNTNSCRTLDSLASSGIRHRNAFYIFDDIATGINIHLFYIFLQACSCLCCRIGNRNRLCTPHRRNELFFQQGHISSVLCILFFHKISPFSHFALTSL